MNDALITIGDLLVEVDVTGAQGGTGNKGDPGGNAMAIGLFTSAAGLSIPNGTDLVQTSGYSVVGLGMARFVYDATVDAAYVLTRSRSSFVSANGRGFRLAEERPLITMYGAIGDCIVTAGVPAGTDDTAAILAAITDLGANGYLGAPAGRRFLSDTLTFTSKMGATVEFLSPLYIKPGSTDGVVITGPAVFVDGGYYFHTISTGRTTNPAPWATLIGSGLKLTDLAEADVDVGAIFGFAEGVDFNSATETGCYFNRVRVGRIRYCNTGVRLSTGDGPAGFTNGNMAHVRSFRGNVGIGTRKGAAQWDPFNGNTIFMNIENADGNAIDLDFCAGNNFRGRLEGGPGALDALWVKTAVGCYGNQFQISNVPLAKIEMHGRGDHIIGSVLSPDGVSISSKAEMDHEAAALHLQLFHDKPYSPANLPLTVNGIAVRYIVNWADRGVVDSGDGGFVPVKIFDANGVKRLNYGGERYKLIDNTASTTLTINERSLAVKSDTAAVKIIAAPGQSRDGRWMWIDVLAYANGITIRDANDSFNLVAGGTINSTGLWLVFLHHSTSTKVYKMSDREGVAVPAPAGGATVDAEARAALTSLLTSLRAAGVIQT